jgi:hypothetical protein
MGNEVINKTKCKLQEYSTNDKGGKDLRANLETDLKLEKVK